MKIRLEFPTEKHQNKANRFKKEFFDNKEFEINGSALFDKMEYKKWLIQTRNNNNIKTVREDWVLASTFFVFAGKKLVGMVDIRHNLGNENLKKYFGHIGYSVRPSERRKGYATAMLKSALKFANSIGLEEVMIACFADNLASNKTILKCGGLLKKSKPYLTPINIYFVKTK